MKQKKQEIKQKLEPEQKATIGLNLAAALVTIGALVFLFLPYWTTDQGELYSINKYVWFPLDSTSFVNWLKTIPGLLEDTSKAGTELFLNSFVGGPVLLLVLGGISAFLGLVKNDREWISLLFTAEGISGVVVFLTTPLLKVSGSDAGSRAIQIALYAVVAVLGAAGVVLLVKMLLKKRAKFLAYQ